MVVTLINRFTLSGTPEAFEEAFERTARFVRGQPGFLRHTLSRHLEQDTSYVNVAVWESVEALRAAVAHPAFRAHSGALRALATSEAQVYGQRLTVEGT